MENVIIVAILTAIAGGIIFYLIKARRRGQTCIGCPHAKACSDKQCCTCKPPKNDEKSA